MKAGEGEPISDRYYVYRPLLDLIGLTECTDKGRGYNESLAYGRLTGGPVDLVGMTLTQIDGLQTRMLQHRLSMAESMMPLYTINQETRNTLRIDEIGSIEKEQGVYDDNGNELTPPVLVESHHVNLVAYGKLAELLETNGGWEAIFSLLGVMTEVDSENGVPEGWQGSSGMRIYHKDFVKNPVRIWA